MRHPRGACTNLPKGNLVFITTSPFVGIFIKSGEGNGGDTWWDSGVIQKVRNEPAGSLGALRALAPDRNPDVPAFACPMKSLYVFVL